ncbi:MAG: hypothetical protein JWQ95_1849 [Sphaerisporangium sp.]|nr:hypothetical protein [Sphaerisporangium sp.]
MKKIKGALLALVVAGLLGAGATPAAAVEVDPGVSLVYGLDSHWMDPGEG